VNANVALPSNAEEVRTIISFLLTPGLDPNIDRICVDLLKVPKHPVNIGIHTYVARQFHQSPPRSLTSWHLVRILQPYMQIMIPGLCGAYHRRSLLGEQQLSLHYCRYCFITKVSWYSLFLFPSDLLHFLLVSGFSRCRDSDNVLHYRPGSACG
jgi:hypothetical protein